MTKGRRTCALLLEQRVLLQPCERQCGNNPSNHVCAVVRELQGTLEPVSKSSVCANERTSADCCDRTIHSMVYNAMKMFMEINPQLFDECSHDYTEQQNSSEQREKTRLDRWDMIEQQATNRKNGVPPPPAPAHALDVPESIDEVEAMTHENQKRLNTLKLQEDSETSKERPAKEGTPTSVSRVPF